MKFVLLSNFYPAFFEAKMKNQKGILFGVGVGPGDSELMTLKSCRIIRENDVISFPGKSASDSQAYKIALRAVPEIAQKTLIPLYFPMSMDLKVQTECHQKAAAKLESFLEKGKNVVYLTLGDVSVYSTFSYLQKIIENDGFQTELVSGVTSFSAAAARLKISLAEWREPLFIIPALHHLDDDSLLNLHGNFVLMKSGSKMAEVKEKLKNHGFDVKMAENVGMENEKIYQNLDEIPDNAGYFSLIIAKH